MASAPPDPLAGFKGAYFYREGKGMGKEGKGKWERRRRGGGKERKRRRKREGERGDGVLLSGEDRRPCAYILKVGWHAVSGHCV